MGRQAAGVQGIRLREGDAVTSMDVVDKDGSLLVVTTGGYGKQTPLSEYTPKGRATAGIATIDQKALEEIGRIAAARVVQKDDDLTIITAKWGRAAAEGAGGQAGRTRHERRSPDQAPEVTMLLLWPASLPKI